MCIQFLQINALTRSKHCLKNEQQIRNEHAVTDQYNVHLKDIGLDPRAKVVNCVWNNCNTKRHGHAGVYVFLYFPCFLYNRTFYFRFQLLLFRHIACGYELLK